MMQTVRLRWMEVVNVTVGHTSKTNPVFFNNLVSECVYSASERNDEMLSYSCRCPCVYSMFILASLVFSLLLVSKTKLLVQSEDGPVSIWFVWTKSVPQNCIALMSQRRTKSRSLCLFTSFCLAYFVPSSCSQHEQHVFQKLYPSVCWSYAHCQSVRPSHQKNRRSLCKNHIST